MPHMPENINALLQQCFDKVLVLTVPRFKERQERIKERLAGVDFEFYYGIDKNDLTEKFIRENYKHDKRKTVTVSLYSKPLNPGEIACSLSHRNIYQAMIDNKWEKVLVFEDDVVPEYKNISLLAGMIHELPRDWELLYLGYLKNEKPGYRSQLKHFWYKIQSSLGFSKLPYSMVKNLLPKAFSQNLMKAGYHDCTHAYAITLAGARKLLAVQTPVQYRADNAISYLVLKNAIKAFAGKPPLFHQEVFIDNSSKSYIR